MESKVLELIQNPEYYEALKRIVEYEEREEPERKRLGISMFWEWSDVLVPPHVLRKLALEGVLEIVASSRRRKVYRLRDRELVKRVLERVERGAEAERVEAPAGGEVEIPPDLFSVIEGYNDVKELVLMSLRSERPVHFLLVGPPATAKSLFLMEIERLPGSVFVTAGTATKVGLRDLIVERRPRYLLIDEIDKVQDPRDLSVLLTLMESQRITYAIHGKYVSEEVRCWVFAAANRDDRLPPELKSRFLVLYFHPYTREQLVRVATRVLVEREGVERGLAEYIAQRVAALSQDVRDAVKVARLARTKEQVDRVLEVIKKYRKS